MKHPTVNSFSAHYRRKYCRGVGKIPLHAGPACPNRRHGGCIYCRPGSFAPGYLDRNDPVSRQIARGKTHLLRDRFQLFFGYFQQETATSLAAGELLPMLIPVLADPDCVGIILSARPDCLEKPLLESLAELAARTGREFLLEIGLQSSHERSLRFLNRNHSVQDFIDAVRRVKNFPGLQTGGHLIMGIPGESVEDMRVTLRLAAALGIDALKLHHLQVIRGTPLHAMYRRGDIKVFTAREYLELLTLLLPEISRRVVIHRLWSHSHPGLLAAPRWNMLAGELRVRLDRMMEKRGIWQGKNHDALCKQSRSGTAGN
jgi:hypothetical protein